MDFLHFLHLISFGKFLAREFLGFLFLQKTEENWFDKITCKLQCLECNSVCKCNLFIELVLTSTVTIIFGALFTFLQSKLHTTLSLWVLIIIKYKPVLMVLCIPKGRIRIKYFLLKHIVDWIEATWFTYMYSWVNHFCKQLRSIFSFYVVESWKSLQFTFSLQFTLDIIWTYSDPRHPLAMKE